MKSSNSSLEGVFIMTNLDMGIRVGVSCRCRSHLLLCRNEFGLGLHNVQDRNEHWTDQSTQGIRLRHLDNVFEDCWC